MGQAVMGIERARAILRGRHGSLDRLGPAYVEYATAAATAVDHYREHPEQLRPVAVTLRDGGGIDWVKYARTLSARTVAADQQQEMAKMRASGWLTAFRDQAATEVGQPAGNASPGGVTIGSEGGGRVGSKLLQRLPGKGTRYFISGLPDDPDNCGLYESIDINGEADTMQVSVSDRRRRAQLEYADSVSRTKMRRISEANAAFWSKHQR